ncbi:MAG: hypothetical protein J6C62_03175 [Clostridia bacterium]|nr:hypothetical protein [Clostridia bacterium]
MSSRIRVIFMSCITIMVCVAVMAVGTFALFAETFKVTNHLTAGTLDVTLHRTYLLVGNTNYSGAPATNDDEVNFTNTNSSQANIFGTDNTTAICPGDYFEATMRLTNGVESKSDVDVNYTIEIVLSADQTKPENKALLDQMEVTIYKSDVNNTKGAKYDLPNGTKTQETKLAKGETTYFIVRVEFVNGNAQNGFNNDLAQNGTISFDMTVNAVQII